YIPKPQAQPSSGSCPADPTRKQQPPPSSGTPARPFRRERRCIFGSPARTTTQVMRVAARVATRLCSPSAPPASGQIWISHDSDSVYGGLPAAFLGLLPRYMPTTGPAFGDNHEIPRCHDTGGCSVHERTARPCRFDFQICPV